MNMRWLMPAAVCAAGLPAALWADWPQWRGPNRDARATDFKAPATWPKVLTQKWKVTVGDGVATPALVGDTLYVFSRQEGQEVTRALDAGTGKERSKNEYESQGATGPAQGFSGPRASPAVADGKVVTLGVRGVVSCLDAKSGKVLWVLADDVELREGTVLFVRQHENRREVVAGFSLMVVDHFGRPDAFATGAEGDG